MPPVPDSLPREALAVTLDDTGRRPYRLRLRQDWTGRGAGAWRSGWLIALRSGPLRGLGDCAPLPVAGTEYADAAGAALDAALEVFRGRSLGECRDMLGQFDRLPAARCALETALLDLAGRFTARPVYRLLGASSARRSVGVNALLGPLDRGVLDRASRSISRGFRVLKIKLAVFPPALEIRRLRILAKRLPAGVSLRLDVNRGWDVPTALCAFRAWRQLPIESVEEPLNVGSHGSLSRLQQACDWPLAVDESLAAGREDLSGYHGVARWVLKPMVLGGPAAAMSMVSRARREGVDAVVTTTLDSAIGRTAALHLAAAADAGVAHGLATGEWLREDLATGPDSAGGRIRVPSLPGLGIETRYV